MEHFMMIVVIMMWCTVRL